MDFCPENWFGVCFSARILPPECAVYVAGLGMVCNAG
jgi:hypothetical protein